MHASVTIDLEYTDGRPKQRLVTTTYTVIAEIGGTMRVLDDQRRVYLGISKIYTVTVREPAAVTA